MKNILISLVFVLLFVMVSCDSGTKIDTGNTGDSGNTGDTGNSGDTGDICPENDKFCHSQDGLDWSDVSSSYIDWNKAIKYCEDLGGRLPTISELRTLIQNCSGTETGGECGVTDSCLSSEDCWNDPCYGCEYDESGKYSVFGDTYWFWSSSEWSVHTNYAWYVDFHYGPVLSYYKDYYHSVRCLR
mgnify:CR=1 FL=1